MKNAFFDFEEESKMWCISTSDFTYKMPFVLMLDLKRYLRESSDLLDLSIKVRKWYKHLYPAAKQKVHLECNKESFNIPVFKNPIIS